MSSWIASSHPRGRPVVFQQRQRGVLGVMEWIRTTTDGTLQIEDGALYTSLHRMEQRGWLDHEWRVSPKGRRAKYYRLTVEGRKQLRAGERSWARFAEAVSKVFAARERA